MNEAIFFCVLVTHIRTSNETTDMSARLTLEEIEKYVDGRRGGSRVYVRNAPYKNLDGYLPAYLSYKSDAREWCKEVGKRIYSGKAYL